MDIGQVTQLVQALVMGANQAIDVRVKRCEDDCKQALEEMKSLRSLADRMEGAELKEKLEQVLDRISEMEKSDVRTKEQLAFIFEKLGMKEQAESVRKEIHIHGDNATVNQTAGDHIEGDQNERTGTGN